MKKLFLRLELPVKFQDFLFVARLWNRHFCLFVQYVYARVSKDFQKLQRIALKCCIGFYRKVTMKWKQIKLPMKVNHLSPMFPFPHKKRFGFFVASFLDTSIKVSFFYSCLFDGPCLRRGIHNSFISKPKCENLGNIQFLKTNTINQSECSIQRAGKSARACRDLYLLLVLKKSGVRIFSQSLSNITTNQ